MLTIFIHQSGNNNFIASTEFVYEKPGINRHASANVTDVVDVNSWYVYFQPRILDVTEVFVLKYCPLWLNVTSKSETEMFSMNNQGQMFH